MTSCSQSRAALITFQRCCFSEAPATVLIISRWLLGLCGKSGCSQIVIIIRPQKTFYMSMAFCWMFLQNRPKKLKNVTESKNMVFHLKTALPVWVVCVFLSYMECIQTWSSFMLWCLFLSVEIDVGMEVKFRRSRRCFRLWWVKIKGTLHSS